MVDIFAALTRDGVLSVLLYADDLVLMSEDIFQPRNMFIKLRKASDSWV